VLNYEYNVEFKNYHAPIFMKFLQWKAHSFGYFALRINTDSKFCIYLTIFMKLITLHTAMIIKFQYIYSFSVISIMS